MSMRAHRRRARALTRLMKSFGLALSSLELTDPRTGHPPDSWGRMEELYVGRLIRGESVPEAPTPATILPIERRIAIAPWRRAVL